jgi:hypothetical protein
MHTVQHRTRKGAGSRSLALAIITTLAMSSGVHAQQATSGDAATRTQLVQIERTMQVMRAEIDVLKAQNRSQAAELAQKELPKSDVQTAAKSTIQSAPIVPKGKPATAFSYGGFIRAEGIYTHTTDGTIAPNSLGRRQYAPSSIPIGGKNSGTDFNTTAQHSRFWFSADNASESGDKVKAYIEMDFGTDINGNQLSTNSYTPRLRHAYVSWNHWLAGQTWTNFQDPSVLPEAGPLLGPTEGTVFARQVQLRYTNGPWVFAAENSETLLQPYQGKGGRISSDANNVPDLTGRYTFKGNKWHVGVAGIARQLRYRNTTGRTSSALGYGLSVSGETAFGQREEISGMLTAGRGIGRYLGYSLNPDGVLNARDNIDNIDLVAGFIAWKHGFNSQLRSNLYVSVANYDNDLPLTGTAITRWSRSYHANLIYSPLRNLDIGVELLWGLRKIESGDSGNLYRMHSFVKYNF